MTCKADYCPPNVYNPELLPGYSRPIDKQFSSEMKSAAHQQRPQVKLNPSMNYNINLENLMTAYRVVLAIKDMKMINMALDSFDYYLKVQYEEEQPEITPCKNVVRQDGVFNLKGGKNMTKLEFWDYNTQKRAATLLIKKFNPKKTFKGDFQKSNLCVEISKPVSLIQSTVNNKQDIAERKASSKSTKSSYV